MMSSEFVAATQWAFFSLALDYFGDWHTAPMKQIFFCLSGEVEAEVSNGAMRKQDP